jgi:hypothetical protein
LVHDFNNRDGRLRRNARNLSPYEFIEHGVAQNKNGFAGKSGHDFIDA